MREAPLLSNELCLSHCWASGSHPVPPTAGGYVLVDSSPMLAAMAPGAISAVLVLPREDEPPSASCPGLPDPLR